ncbi:MAG TPA: hypothetical protein VN883_13080 [Myxococcales bacterium]|nr:hypothetical protein [Myxococcales bacterium]
MQLSELLYQRVKEMGERGQLVLKPGYCVVVGKSRSLKHVLLGALFQNPDDQRNLAEAGGATRVGVGLVGGGAAQYRLLRELGQGRNLQKFDPAQKKFAPVTDDDMEIESFLRVECGLPNAETYAAFFVFDFAELPSQRGKPGAAASVDQVKVKALRDELEQTKHFEAVQDRLFKAQQRLHELGTLSQQVAAAEADLAALNAELGRSPFTPEQLEQLAGKASSAKADQKKRDDVLGEIALQRQRLARSLPQPPDPLFRDPFFGGGIAGGMLLDGVAFILRKPPVALLGLVPFAAALIASLRWVAADEADAHAVGETKRLKDREDSVRKTFAEDQAQLKAAMKAANVDSPADLLEVFQAREVVAGKREQAKARLEKVRKNPEIARIPIETPLLESEKQKLEAQVLQQGFARPIAEIEIDLKHALGLGADKKISPQSEGEVAKDLVARAADLMQLSPEELWTQLAPRLAAYLTALTDKRIVAGKPDANGLLVLAAADGRSGPYHGLPQPLKDLAYAALRLTVLEKVASYKKLPIFIDDAFAGFDAAKRALVHKMLKGISALTQIVHRTPEPPPQGVADHLAQTP